MLAIAKVCAGTLAPLYDPGRDTLPVPPIAPLFDPKGATVLISSKALLRAVESSLPATFKVFIFSFIAGTTSSSKSSSFTNVLPDFSRASVAL